MLVVPVVVLPLLLLPPPLLLLLLLTTSGGRSCRNGHDEACRLLLEAGADVEAVDNDGRNALMEAAIGKQYCPLEWNDSGRLWTEV